MICKECTSTVCPECKGTGKINGIFEVLDINHPSVLCKFEGCDRGQLVAPAEMHEACVERNKGKDTEDCDCQHRKPIGLRGGSIFG